MAVFGPVVRPAPNLLFAGVTKLSHRSFVRGETIGRDLSGRTVALERLLHEPQRCLLVARLRHVALEDLALLIDPAPQVMQLSVDLHVDLIEVPFPLPETAHSTHPLTLHIGSEQRPKSVPPQPSRLVANINPSLSQQFRSESGNRTYIITTRQIISGEELK